MTRPTIPAALAAALLGVTGAGAAEPNGPLLAQACAGCHGQSGAGEGSVPDIRGYQPDDFVQVWEEFRQGNRPATIMGRIARGYTEAEVAALAAYFAAQE